jgi:hypothetical protein
VFVLGKPFQPNLTFVSDARAWPSKIPSKAPALLANIRHGQPSVTTKKSFTTSPKKTFFRNLQIFVIS